MHWLVFLKNNHISVCRYLNNTCNVHGTSHYCQEDKCVCLEGYEGDLCQFCESSSERQCMVIDNTITDGTLDTFSGAGVQCSCEIPDESPITIS